MNDKTAYCPACKLDKPLNEFYKRPERASGRYGYCKACFNDYNDKRRLLLKEKAIQHKGSKCERCGIGYPELPSCAFDFHHINPKEKDGWAGFGKWGWDKIQKEINKCKLLCANCHRIVEYGEGGGS